MRPAVYTSFITQTQWWPNNAQHNRARMNTITLLNRYLIDNRYIHLHKEHLEKRKQCYLPWEEREQSFHWLKRSLLKPNTWNSSWITVCTKIKKNNKEQMHSQCLFFEQFTLVRHTHCHLHKMLMCVSFHTECLSTDDHSPSQGTPLWVCLTVSSISQYTRLKRQRGKNITDIVRQPAIVVINSLFSPLVKTKPIFSERTLACGKQGWKFFMI